MEEAPILGRMAENIRASINSTRNTVSAPTHGKTAESTLENGKTARGMAGEKLSQLMAVKGKEFGRKTSRLTIARRRVVTLNPHIAKLLERT